MRVIKIEKIAKVAIVVVPIIFLLIIILRYSLNTPYGLDDLSMVPIFQDIDSGDLPVSKLWEPWNGHRIPLSRAVIVFSAYLTGWNKVVELYISVAFTSLTALFLYLLLRKDIKNQQLLWTALSLSLFWLFSPVQSENWLWGFCMPWFMCVLGIVSSVYFLTNKKPIILAIGSAIFATLSLGGGILIWPIGLVILVLLNQKKYLRTWIESSYIIGVIYYVGFNPANDGSLTSFLSQPLNVLKAYLILFGRPFISDINGATLLGSVSLSLLAPISYLLWTEKKNFLKYLPMVSLVVFSLLATALIALGRIQDGIYNVSGTRYTTFTVVYIIGIIGIFFIYAESVKRSKKFISIFIISAISISVPLLISSYSTGVSTSKLWKTQIINTRNCYIEEVKSCSLPDEQWKQIEYIRAKNWAGF